MKKVFAVTAAIALLCLGGIAQATPAWHTISFTGTDMFNYTTSVAPLADQDAPRGVRFLDAAGNITTGFGSAQDADSDGTNDFAEWAQGTPGLAGYGFSRFQLCGTTDPPGVWGQKYQPVPDQGDGRFGVDSWRNQTVPTGWTGTIVMANQPYNLDDCAFPAWTAPTGTQLTMANAASLWFSVDVLMENPDSAFESDGGLRVWFGGSNVPRGTAEASQGVAGIVVVPAVPEPSSLIALGALVAPLLAFRRRRA